MAEDGYLVIHGHFYQPPRENPWLGIVEKEASAHPWHDWNRRITEECYAPNWWARVYGPKGELKEVLNNYAFMSFDFGPTLLNWLRRHAPRVYKAILLGDLQSRRRYGGHGAAIAHPYSHIILPLAHPEDRRLDIHWGILDFRLRFGRDPEGMWLPECAVDTDTLEDLVDEGISFVLLSPQQAKRTRRPEGYWQEVDGSRMDTFRPYKVKLPSGRELSVFFLHHGLSMGVSFGDLLRDGEKFLWAIREAMPQGGHPLVAIVSDGETFGHHKPFGEMALSYIFWTLQRKEGPKLTVFGEFLEKYPPEDEVELHERSSWSCAHGLGRWERDCGCSTGAHPEWNQKWRRPLREALNWLRENLRDLFATEGEKVFFDPQRARLEYMEVFVEPSRKEAFLKEHLKGSHPGKALGLLEMERESLLMFTSCAWFFDDPSGIETLLALKHAARAIDLARIYGGIDLERGFLERLREVKSNIPEKGTGKDLYLKEVIPHRVDVEKAAFHALMHPLLGEKRERLGAYRTSYPSEEERKLGKARLRIGEVVLEDERTLEKASFPFALLDFGDHNLLCSLGDVDLQGIKGAFEAGDLATASLLIRETQGKTFTLLSLLDEFKEKVLYGLLEEKWKGLYPFIEGHYMECLPLVQLTRSLGLKIPPDLSALSHCVLLGKAKKALEELSPELLEEVLREARVLGVEVDLSHLRGEMAERFNSYLEEMLDRKGDVDLKELKKAVEICKTLGVPLGKFQAYLFMLVKGQREALSQELRDLAQAFSIEV